MAIVDLTVLKVNRNWAVMLGRGSATQLLGSTRNRNEIEAFAARLMADLVAQGDCPLLKVTPPSPASRARRHRPRVAHEISSTRT
jgi:hypothetical protein